MLIVAEILFFTVFAILVIPVLTFCIQILVAVLPGFRNQKVQPQSASIALLIPAHNESTGISATLESIKKSATPNTRIVVIADNCSDNTAEIARSNGVEVIERVHETLRGKGYALDFGIQHLKTNPPEVMIVFDADCIVYPDTINALAQAVIKGKRAVQALYLIQAKPNSPVKTKLAEFAYVVKSWTRPLGFYRLGMPMQLMGSGMAFPWEHVKNANLAKGYIVEDMKLGIDLAEQRLAPKFCPEAYVTSEFPLNDEGADSQRKRWEHGHIGMIVQEGLPLFFKGLRTANIEMTAMALDLCVPPVALLFLLSALFAIISAVLILLTNTTFPWGYGVIQFLLLALFVMISWVKHGTKILPFFELLTYAPVYAISKIQLYAKFFVNRQIEWVKSKRD
ncbi:glycosyltransferase family 2 protein [Methylophilus sp. 3sh_L]|uniref:glycosyltransferase family 2 protein n=1 Tax=Methylophilus sp. 3sh_L TaxID=3377114 RepID=UPI00398ED455